MKFVFWSRQMYCRSDSTIHHCVRLVSLKHLLQTRKLTPVSPQCFVVVALLAAYKLFIPLFFILFNNTLSTSNISSNSSFGKVSGNALVGSVLGSGQGYNLFRISKYPFWFWELCNALSNGFRCSIEQTWYNYYIFLQAGLPTFRGQVTWATKFFWNATCP